MAESDRDPSSTAGVPTLAARARVAARAAARLGRASGESGLSFGRVGPNRSPSRNPNSDPNPNPRFWIDFPSSLPVELIELMFDGDVKGLGIAIVSRRA